METYFQHLLLFLEAFFLVTFITVPSMLLFLPWGCDQYRNRRLLRLFLFLILAVCLARLGIWLGNAGASRRYQLPIVWLLSMICVPGIWGAVKLVCYIPFRHKQRFARVLFAVLVLVICGVSIAKALNPPSRKDILWREIQSHLSRYDKPAFLVLLDDTPWRLSRKLNVTAVNVSWPDSASGIRETILHLREGLCDPSQNVFLLDRKKRMPEILPELEQSFYLDAAGDFSPYTLYQVRNRRQIAGRTELFFPEAFYWAADSNLRLYTPALFASEDARVELSTSWTIDAAGCITFVSGMTQSRSWQAPLRAQLPDGTMGAFVYCSWKAAVPGEINREEFFASLGDAFPTQDDFQLDFAGTSARFLVFSPPDNYLRLPMTERLSFLAEANRTARQFPMSTRENIVHLPLYAFLTPGDYDESGKVRPEKRMAVLREMLFGFFLFHSD